MRPRFPAGPEPQRSAVRETDTADDSPDSSAPVRAGGRLRHAITAQLRPRDLAAFLFLAGCGLLLFRLSLFQGWTFIGDSDRANTFLNIRLFEVRSLQELGRVPTWNDQFFLGIGMTELHYMAPGASPFPYLIALLPQTETFRASNVVSVGLLILAGWVSYLALRPYTVQPLAAVVGAVAYGGSAYAIHRLAQLDASFSILVILPFLLLLVRKTHRSTASTCYLVLAGLWASLVLLTFLQEVAYVALLFGAYALYRSVRLRDPWPVLVGGLAFGVGALIGLPRVLTVATDFGELARSSASLETPAIEALRFFGDGLLGRFMGEQRGLLGGSLNVHEGVQLLNSSLAGLCVVAAGLAARSRLMRLLGVTLVVILSIPLMPGWTPDYTPGRPLYPSTELRAALTSALFLGLPLWFGCAWLAAWMRGPTDDRPDSRPTVMAPGTPPAAVADGPFFLGVVLLALSTILIPEAHELLYSAFLRVDFTHARVSIAALFPCAALTTMALDRLLSSSSGRRAFWMVVSGGALGLLLWVVREAAGAVIVAESGPTLNMLPSARLLTVEVVRVITSLFVMLGVLAMLIRGGSPSARTLAGAVLTAWIVLEVGVSADFKVNGPHTYGQAFPFEAFNYLHVPPGQLRIPSTAERTAVEQRLEVDRYRTVLLQDGTQFRARVEPHLAALWGLRLVEGYGGGLPRRIGMLPWGAGQTTPQILDFQTGDTLPWRLLAALNVKYAVTVDPSFWLNPGPGGPVPPLDLAQLQVQENPFPVTPRVFFTEEASPAGQPPLTPVEAFVEEPARQSVVEGIESERRYATDGAIDVVFDGDRILVRFEPSSAERFLVLNERYHPAWRAWIDDRPTQIYPTNVVMRGVVAPPGSTSVIFRHVPLLLSWTGGGMLLLALGVGMVCWWGLRRRVKA